MLHAAIMLILGLMMGSFASAVAYRLPRGIDFVWSRSCCPRCHHVLSASDLIPILSWIWLRGRCRYCGMAYGVRYIALELIFALSFACIGYVFSDIYLIVCLCVAVFVTYVALLMQYEDKATFPVGVLLFAVSGVSFQFVSNEATAVTYVLPIVSAGFIGLYLSRLSKFSRVDWVIQVAVLFAVLAWLPLPIGFAIMAIWITCYLVSGRRLVPARGIVAAEGLMIIPILYWCFVGFFL